MVKSCSPFTTWIEKKQKTKAKFIQSHHPNLNMKTTFRWMAWFQQVSLKTWGKSRLNSFQQLQIRLQIIIWMIVLVSFSFPVFGSLIKKKRLSCFVRSKFSQQKNTLYIVHVEIIQNKTTLVQGEKKQLFCKSTYNNLIKNGLLS